MILTQQSDCSGLPSQLPTSPSLTYQPSNAAFVSRMLLRDLLTSMRSTVLALSPYHSHSYKCPLPQPLSFDNHTNAPGCGGYARSSALFCRFLHQECCTTLFQSSASTLFLKTAGVSPNNSHFGSPRASRGTRRPPLPPSQPSTFKPSNMQTVLCPTSHLSEGRASDVLLERTCLSDKLSSGHHSVRSFCVGGCDG